MEETITKHLVPPKQLFINQTELVAALLCLASGYEEEITSKPLQELADFNIWEYSIKTPTGNLLLTEDEYYDQVNTYENQLRAQKQHPDKEKFQQEIDELEKITLAYDNATASRRHVYSWWVVPHWLSDMLIEKGEAVLRGYGSNWWGIADKDVPHPLISAVLINICTELSNSPSNDNNHHGTETSYTQF